MLDKKEYYNKFINKIIENKESKIIKTDLIIPAGYNCITAISLRDDGFNLRKFSSPWDFVFFTENNLDTLLKIFKSKKFNWFKNRTVLNTHSAKKDNIIDVMDNETGLIDAHHFPTNFDDNFFNKIYYPMMKKRYKRIIKFIKNSNSITFISFLGRNTNEEIFNFLVEFDKIFHNKEYNYISIFNYKNCEYKERTFIKDKFKIIKIDSQFFKYEFGYWEADKNHKIRKKLLKQFYERIQLSNKNLIKK